MTAAEISAETLSVPSAPDVPGLTFRRFAGAADYARMWAVIEGCKAVDQIERTQTVEDVARYYAHLVNCDPREDMLFVEVDGGVAGYGRCEWRVDGDGHRLYTFIIFLLPAWRGQGIDRAMLAWLEQRLRTIAAQHPADGPRWLQTFGSDTEHDREALLSAEGYAAIRHGFRMVRPLSEPVAQTPMPDGLEVRPARPEQYRAVWEADQEAFRDHWGYVAGTETDYQNWLTGPEFNPHLWQVAWDGDEVAGMVLNFVNEKENREYTRRRGYTEGIAVRRPWRRRGLARALLTRSLQMFKDMGMAEAALAVDAENLSGALRLYESVGFRVVKRESVYRKPLA